MTKPLEEIAFRLPRPNRFAIWVFDRLFDSLLDRRFGIRSSRRISLASLGLAAPDRADYQPISYLDFSAMMKGIAPRGTFVDFGCGAGRCVCLAATLPFERVIGVELSERLCAEARRNIALRRAAKTEIVCADATMFAIPPDATAFSFINPFRGKTLSQVLANIVASIARRPRDVTLVAYGSPVDHEFFQAFEQHPGLQVESRTVLPTGCVVLRLAVAILGTADGSAADVSRAGRSP